MSNDHDLLGIKPGATEEEIRQAYLEMVKVWHPDRFTHDPKLQDKAQEKLKELNHAYERLLRPPVNATHPSSGPAFDHAVNSSAYYARERRGGVWIILAVIVMAVAGALYFSIKNSESQRVINPKSFSQESILLDGTGTRKFLLKSESGKNVYIIEGPRVPLDWEIDGLVDSYEHNLPKKKKQLGNFTISQSFKPGDNKLTPLSYHAKD